MNIEKQGRKTKANYTKASYAAFAISIEPNRDRKPEE